MISWKQGMKKKIIQLDTTFCGTCQNCIQVCPHGIWATDSDKRTIINENNIGACPMDNECVKACPTGAIEIVPNMT